MKKRLTPAQRRQRQARLMRKAEEPVEDKYHHDPVVAAKAIDGEIIRARGETPPWEEEVS